LLLPGRPGCHWRFGWNGGTRRRPGELAEAAQQLHAILVAHVGIGDGRGMVDEAASKPRFLLGRGEGLGSAFVLPKALDKRFGLIEQRFQRLAAGGADEVVRVLTGGHGDEGERTAGADMGKGAKSGADRGFLPRGVAVETEQGGRRELPQQFELGFGERGAKRGDCFAYPCLVEGDHVHLAFDNDHPIGAPAGGRRLVDVEQAAALVEQWGIGRVQIFGLAGAEDACAERDHAAAAVADRVGEAAAKRS
jgi:hypothetical protein